MDGKLDDETMMRVSVAKRQWERTFDAISESLMIVASDYGIRRANVALADELGLAIQQVVGQRCYQLRARSGRPLVGSAIGPCEGCPVGEAQRTREGREGEVRSSDGRTFRLRAFPLLDEEVPMTICHYRDVTDERQLTQHLASVEKLAAIGRLAGGVAHEINNPLAGILACAQILQRDDVTAEERQDYLADIERSTLRCKAIVQSLLRFARQAQQGHRRTLALNDVVEGAVRTMRQKQDGSAMNLRLSLDPEPATISGDAPQLQQLVVNLLTNALDSIGPGQPGGEIQIATAYSDTEVLLTVADTGAGIAPEHLARLFDPFFTTKELGKGTGLGLAVSYAIVREHGGRIEAANRPTGGALFTVTLPRAS